MTVILSSRRRCSQGTKRRTISRHRNVTPQGAVRAAGAVAAIDARLRRSAGGRRGKHREEILDALDAMDTEVGEAGTRIDGEAAPGVLVEDTAHEDLAVPLRVACRDGEAFAESEGVAVVRTEHDGVGVFVA